MTLFFELCFNTFPFALSSLFLEVNSVNVGDVFGRGVNDGRIFHFSA